MSEIRRYTPEFKMTAKYLALRYSPESAAKQVEMPLNTLYQWLWEDGGVRQLRASIQEQTGTILYAAESEIFKELIRRASSFQDGEIISIFQDLIKLYHPAPEKGGSQATAGAQATAGVQVFQIGGGQPKALEECTDEELEVIDAQLAIEEERAGSNDTDS